MVRAHSKRIAIAVATLLLWGCGGGTVAPSGNTEAQKQAISALQQQLRSSDSLKDDSSALGLFGVVFSAAFAFMPTYSAPTTGYPGGAITQPLGEECVTQSGTTITYACPTVTGSVSLDGDTTNINLKITGGIANVPNVGSMLISGYLIEREGYASGKLYFEMETSNGTGSMTVDFEIFDNGPCSRGWITFTWGGANPMSSPYELVRVTFDCDLFDVTYQ